MVKDAEAHAEEDKARREEAEVRNNADSLVYQTEKVLREQGENVSDEEKAAVEGPLAELKAALEGTDTAAIKEASEKLMASSQEFSQKLYEAAARTMRPELQHQDLQMSQQMMTSLMLRLSTNNE